MVLTCMDRFWKRSWGKLQTLVLWMVEEQVMQCLFWGDWHKSIGPKTKSCFIIVCIYIYIYIYIPQDILSNFILRHWNTGLVSSRANLTSWGEDTTLALVGHPYSNGVIIKMPYRVDVLLHRPVLHPIFSYFLHELSPWGYISRCFLVALCHLVLWRTNLEVATKRFLHQQLKILG